MAKKNNYKHGKRTFSDIFMGNSSANTEPEFGEAENQVADVEMREQATGEEQEYSESIFTKGDTDYTEYEYVAGEEQETSHEVSMEDLEGDMEDAEQYQEPMERMQTTTISTDTVITGEISSNGHIEIFGNLNGNVNAKGNVRIYGQVVGDIKGNNIELVSCKVRGNINADAAVQINNESVVAGNIAAADMILDGKLKGDVMLQRTTLFMENAVLFGNVYAGMISIKNGAKLYGEIQIENGNDDEAFAEL